MQPSRQMYLTKASGLLSKRGAPVIRLLDKVPSALYAYGLHLLKSDYSGNCMRVRRSSDDAEADIGFSSGAVDVAAIAAHCGSGSGYVVKWYDQSGNGRDMIQATAAQQPLAYSSGSQVVDAGGVPSILYDGTLTSLYLENLLSAVEAQPLTLLAVHQDAASLSGSVIHGASNDANSTRINLTQNAYQMAATDWVNGPAFSANDRAITLTLFSGSASTMSVNNGTDATGDPGSTELGTRPRIGRQGSAGAAYWTGYIGSIVMWSSSVVASKSSIYSITNANWSVY